MTILNMQGVRIEAPLLVPRQVYMVLSPHSLPYARLAFATLLRNCEEDLHLHLITDSPVDKATLFATVDELKPDTRHTISVIAEEELDDREAAVFATLPNLRAFRRGHPCWRKITDPVLLAQPDAELVLLDPDLYFPNPFRFEQTPSDGLLLMWQRPNCLLPPEVVRAAMKAGIPLARHVDIGVAHWRNNMDLAWVDWLIGRLGGADLPRVMHIEAIVWAAIAMRQGGGYLDPKLWVCWRRSQLKRVLRKLGINGRSILRSEPWAAMKCFHAGGEAKWWLAEAQDEQESKAGQPQRSVGRIQPFIELTAASYEREQKAKHLLRDLGYYRIFGAQT